MAMYFPLRIAFAVSHMFWTIVFSFSLVSINYLNWFLISWFIESLLSRIVLCLQVFEFLPNFPLWLSSNFRAFWSENMQGIISVFWYQLRNVLCPRTWSILENVPRTLEYNEYSLDLRCSVLYISMRSNSSSMAFKSPCFFVDFLHQYSVYFW